MLSGGGYLGIDNKHLRVEEHPDGAIRGGRLLGSGRRIKMNLKNACNIGGEISAKHNAFMFSVIESCKMIKRNVEDYLKAFFRRLRTAKEGEDLTCCLPCYMSF